MQQVLYLLKKRDKTSTTINVNSHSDYTVASVAHEESATWLYISDQEQNIK